MTVQYASSEEGEEEEPEQQPEQLQEEESTEEPPTEVPTSEPIDCYLELAAAVDELGEEEPTALCGECSSPYRRA